MPTILDCASSTTWRRCGGAASMSSRSICAPRWDMLVSIFSRELRRHAAQREREVLLVDLAQQQLDIAVGQDDQVVEGEQPLADAVGELVVALGRSPRRRCARSSDPRG